MNCPPMEVNNILAIGSFLLALGSNAVWLIFSYSNSQKKAYAAERDFNHIRNNQQQLSHAILTGFEDIEDKLDCLDRELLEIKAYLINKNINKINNND